ncbi:unnamed protein product, partial [Owenia fusiformis]
GVQRRSRITSGVTTSQTKTCRTQPCPESGTWERWSTCSKTCGRGLQTRSRMTSGGTIRDTKTCIAQICPDIGIWGAWSNWGSCSESCEGGYQRRSRSCIRGTCSGGITENRRCNSQACENQGVWGNWGAWSSCSKTCGGGTRRRFHTCLRGICVGSFIETQICGQQTCGPEEGVPCVDRHIHCLYWQRNGWCTKSVTYMKVFCTKSCGFCTATSNGATGSSRGVCVDNRQSCASWKQAGECTKNPTYMARYCKKSCGLCSSNSASSPRGNRVSVQVTWWSTQQRACLRGHNDKIIPNTRTLNECRRNCLRETTFTCQSIDFNFLLKHCILSSKTSPVLNPCPNTNFTFSRRMN